jgi:hypothetical protein
LAAANILAGAISNRSLNGTNSTDGASAAEEECSFLKKRTKKLLLVGLRASGSQCTSGNEGAGAKVFCFFFSKKKTFLPSNHPT